MITITIGTALFGLMTLWLFGGLVLRIGGLLMALAGTFGTARSDPYGLLLVVVGALLWQRGAGHWHYALRHQAYKSALARHLFCRWGPAWLDPTRDWAVAMVPDRVGRGGGDGRRRRG